MKRLITSWLNDQADARADLDADWIILLIGGLMQMADLMDIGAFFNDLKIYRIPDYQRGYAWEEPQLKDFWEDLIGVDIGEDNAKDGRMGGRVHFTGTITIKPVERSKIKIKPSDDFSWTGRDLAFIVDGQQRLVTIVIFLATLFKTVEDCGFSYEIIRGTQRNLANLKEKYLFIEKGDGTNDVAFILGYDDTDVSCAGYLRRILGHPDPSADNEDYYTNNMQKAHEFFEKHIKKYAGSDNIVEKCFELFDKLQKFKFNMYDISDETDEYVSFETMNNRGKKLSTLELLKNRLIYLSTLLPNDNDTNVNENARDRINKTWKEVYRWLGRNKDDMLIDDEYLADHTEIYFDNYDSRQKSAVAIHLLTTFSATALKDNQIDYAAISNYVDSVSQMAQWWYYVHNPSDLPEAYKQEKLWLHRFNMMPSFKFRPLITVILSQDHIGHDKRAELFEAIERFTVVNYYIANRRAHYLVAAMTNNARDLYKEKISIEELLKYLEEQTDSSDIAMSNFKKTINDYMNVSYNFNGFFEWDLLKYFLYEYENHLMRILNRDEHYIDWEKFKDNQREHIYPQAPTDEYWVERFGKYDETKQKILMGMLGNFIPLKAPQNKETSNKPFPEKKKIYADGSYSEREIARYSDWTPEDIISRSGELLDFLFDRWRLTDGLTAEQINNFRDSLIGKALLD